MRGPDSPFPSIAHDFGLPFLLVEFIHIVPTRLRPRTAGRGVIAVVALGVGAAVNVGTDERRECSHAKEAVVALAGSKV